MTVATRQNLSLVELWGSTDWSKYAVNQEFTDGASIGNLPSVGYPFSLSTQRHINVRTFNEAAGWTNGGTSYTGGYIGTKHWPGATIVVPIGTSAFTSNYTTPIDLSKLGPNAVLTMALPSFPLSSINLTNSYLDLSSDGFSTAICALKWSTSTPTPSSGNTALTWPLSALTGLDLTKVNGVRLRIAATTGATVLVQALRLIDPDWVYTNMDFDNLNGRLRSTVPLNGDPATVTPANASLPPLWRSADTPGTDDPRPINAKMGFVFNTGSQTAQNAFTIYMREGEAFPTQLDLEGLPQSALQGKPQPTEGVSEYVPATIGELDTQTMADLDGRTMLDLERVADPQTEGWIAFTVTWGPLPQVQIATAANSGYQMTPTAFANSTSYFALCSLVENDAQVTIWSIDPTTQALNTVVFDSTVIRDSYLFRRRAGRIGFQSFMGDGNAYVQALRPQALMFAEYRSQPLNSLTPVIGAQLYAHSSPNVELFSQWVAASADLNGNAPILSNDQSRSTTGQSTKIVIPTPDTSIRVPGQGVLSNVLSVDAAEGIMNFRETEVSFDIWFPSSVSTAGGSLRAQLVNSNGGSIALNMPRIVPDQWQHIILNPAGTNLLAGLYILKLYYQGTVPVTFWIDNVSVFERTMRWSARSVVDDPWKSGIAPWTDFRDLINSDTDGIRFALRGKSLQLRGQALRQNAVVIGPPRLVPKYAELGRLTWPEDAIATTPPVPHVGGVSGGSLSVTHGVPATFDASTSTSSAPLINYQWSFGDGGSGNGKVTTYTYAHTGSYTATLTIIDQYGATAVLSFIVGVS